MSSGAYISSRASLALTGITGEETSELLGITLGLMEIYRHRGSYKLFVVMIDSQNAIDHVFEEKDPVERSGRDLWPCILLARRIVSLLQSIGVKVSAMKVPRRHNLGDCLAKSEMRYRIKHDWRHEDDYWPYPHSSALKSVFHCVARNRRCPGIDLPHCSLSKEVLKSLDNLV